MKDMVINMDNETKEILQLILSEVSVLKQGQENISARLDSIEQLATKTAITQEKMGNKIAEMDVKVDGMGNKIAEMGNKIAEMDSKMEEMGTRLDSIEQLATKTAIVQENDVANKIQLIYENQISIIENNNKLTKHDNRIDNLENDVFALKYAFKALKQE